MAFPHLDGQGLELTVGEATDGGVDDLRLNLRRNTNGIHSQEKEIRADAA